MACMLPELLGWIESTALGGAIRGANAWTYGIINLVHVLGLATLFGAILVLDLRLLGCWRNIPLASIARPTQPLAATGFVLAAVSGVCMLSVNASDYYGNPFMFYVKFPAIFLALCNIAILHFSTAWRAGISGQATATNERQLALQGGISLLLWLTVISAGRLIGYW